MSNALPQCDRDLHGWMVNFLSVANANLDTLGLTSVDLIALTKDATNLGTRLNIITRRKASCEGESVGNDLFRKSALNEAQLLVRRIQAAPGVSDSLKVKLGITASRRSRMLPVAPVEPVASPQGNGTTMHQWNKKASEATIQLAVSA